jgi:hypothetical protein
MSRFDARHRHTIDLVGLGIGDGVGAFSKGKLVADLQGQRGLEFQGVFRPGNLPADDLVAWFVFDAFWECAERGKKFHHAHVPAKDFPNVGELEQESGVDLGDGFQIVKAAVKGGLTFFPQLWQMKNRVPPQTATPGPHSNTYEKTAV